MSVTTEIDIKLITELDTRPVHLKDNRTGMTAGETASHVWMKMKFSV